MGKIENVNKWIVEETTGMNIFEEKFNTKDEALKEADQIWQKWNKHQRKFNNLRVYFLDGIEYFENGDIDYIVTNDFEKVYNINEEPEQSREDFIKELLEYEDLTEKEIEHVIKEMKDIDIADDESFIIKSTGMTRGKNQEVIYQVLLTNGDVERFVCYI